MLDCFGYLQAPNEISPNEEYMDYLLERKVKINRDTEYKSLYAWCLNEFDENGSQIGRDWVPFRWRFWFTGASLQVTNNVTIKRDYETDESKASTSKSIYGKFYSGICTDGKNLSDYVTFGCFGTARTINEFSVTINEEQHGREESCWFFASPSYKSEDAELRKVIEDDFAGFNIYVSSEKFNHLVRLVESRCTDAVRLSVKNLDGVYADWTPTIKTRSAKFLTSDNTIEGVDKADFDGTTVTRVEEFDINFITQASLNIKQNLPSIDFSSEFNDEVDNDDVEKGGMSASNFELNNINLSPLAGFFKDLKIPLWCIFIALVFILIK